MPRADTTTIGVPIPSPRACSMTFQPSRPGQHQVEDTDVRPLVAQPREPGLAVGDPDGVEPRRLEMTSHPLGDEIVVLDDQDLRHAPKVWRRPVVHGDDER